MLSTKFQVFFFFKNWNFRQTLEGIICFLFEQWYQMRKFNFRNFFFEVYLNFKFQKEQTLQRSNNWIFLEIEMFQIQSFFVKKYICSFFYSYEKVLSIIHIPMNLFSRLTKLTFKAHYTNLSYNLDLNVR
jgi:hypothetical protein